MGGAVTVLETPEALAARVAADLAAVVNEQLRQATRFTLALGGGSTPRLLFQALAAEPYRTSIPWGKLWFFWGDERGVPPDHSDSNYRLAKNLLLDHVAVRPSQVFRIPTEKPPAEAARDYEAILRENFRNTAWPRLDLILLGLGADGHTASLFPDTPALGVQDRWATENIIRSLQTVRITLTFPVLNAAARVWFEVSGSKKKAAFEAARSAVDPHVPASLVHPTDGELCWYVDQTVVDSMKV